MPHTPEIDDAILGTAILGTAILGKSSTPIYETLPQSFFTLFGIHEITPYHIRTGLPYGTFRVLEGSALSMAGEIISLFGGSALYPWDAQDGNTTSELIFRPKEIPNFLFKVFLGADPEESLSDSGNVAEVRNVFGNSVISLSGIDSIVVQPGNEESLKFGKYVLLAVSSDEVDIYALSTIDLDPADLALDSKVNDSPIKIVQSVTTIFPDLGVVFVGGTGAINFVPGETAEFELNPPSEIQNSVKVGKNGACIPEFGALMTAQKLSDGTMWLFDVFRVKALGFPLAMEEDEFGAAEITATCMFDSEKNGVFRIRHLLPTKTCN